MGDATPWSKKPFPKSCEDSGIEKIIRPRTTQNNNSFMAYQLSLFHRLFYSYRILTISVVERFCSFGQSAYSLINVLMFQNPVMMYFALLFRNTPDHHHAFRDRDVKRIVVYLDGRARNFGIVLPVAASMHVETMTQGNPLLNIVPRNITTTSDTGARYRMAVFIKQIMFRYRCCV